MTTGVYSIASFIVKLKTIEMELEVVGHAAIAAACQMIADEAKRVIGTYDYGWPSLAPSTLAKKSADTPLLETGKMRASIEWNASGNTGAVGSNSDDSIATAAPIKTIFLNSPMFIDAEIQKRRREIEAAGETPRVVN